MVDSHADQVEKAEAFNKGYRLGLEDGATNESRDVHFTRGFDAGKAERMHRNRSPLRFGIGQ